MVTEGTLPRDALRQVEQRLTAAGCPDADFDAAELLRLVLGVDARLAFAPLTAEQAAWPFLDFELAVGPGVLCPRADTEVVAETAAGLLKEVPHPKVLDLCAGTGCLGLGVKRFCPDAAVTSLEKSPDALVYLKRNARLPGGLEITPVEGDLFTYWQTLPEGQLDLIVSNPPYLTAAEMGTALHAFLEHADFAALAAAKQAGTLEMAIPAERDRQVEEKLTAPEIAEKLDAGRIRRFVESEAFARICAADEVLRELAFITALPASAVLAAQGSPAPDPETAKASVLVQGIADIVLVFPDHLELLDYKTDRRKTEADYLAAYRAQLNLYAIAIEKRFAPKKVTYKGIYSLELGKLIEVK